jgi:hypothetical protein
MGKAPICVDMPVTGEVLRDSLRNRVEMKKPGQIRPDSTVSAQIDAHKYLVAEALS